MVSTGLVQDTGRAFGDKISVDGVDEKQIASVFGFDWEKGSDARTRSWPGGAIVTEVRREDDLAMGDRFEVTAMKGDKLA